MSHVTKEAFIEAYTVNLIDYYNSSNFQNYLSYAGTVNNSLEFIKNSLALLTTRVDLLNTNFKPLAKTIEQFGVDRIQLRRLFNNEKA